jgi:hypothetical protein
MHRSGSGLAGVNGSTLYASRKKRMTNARLRATIELLYWSGFSVEEGEMVKNRLFTHIVLAVALLCCLPSLSEAG